MSTSPIPDLWPEETGREVVVTPLTILKAQAAALGKRTKRLIEAEVETTTLAGDFRHNFVLVAPSLGGYRYSLFAIYHGVLLYPAIVFSGPQTGKHLADERELLDYLGGVFSSEETQRIIRAILSQITTAA